MKNKETSEKRRKQFKEMSSYERKVLLREKIKVQGLEEGSGIKGKGLSSYDRDEIFDLIQITSHLPDRQSK